MRRFCGLRRQFPLYPMLLGGGFGALLLAQKKANRKSQFAFGPFLCIGIAIAMFFGETIADWYMGLL